MLDNMCEVETLEISIKHILLFVQCNSRKDYLGNPMINFT